MKNVKRGDLYMADLDPVKGSEQGGIRPVLIISNDINNRNSRAFLAAPVTSRPKKRLPTHVRLRGIQGLPRDSTVLTEDHRSLDETRFGPYMGHVNSGTMKKVDNALKYSMDLHDEEIKSLITLCGPCAAAYYDTNAYEIRRADRNQTVREVCMFCNTRMGYDYYLTRKNAWRNHVPDEWSE